MIQTCVLVLKAWFITYLKCILQPSESGLSPGIGCLRFLFGWSSQKIGSPSSGICLSFALVSFMLTLYPLMVMILLNSQKLRDEEGKKLGLKAGEKSSTSKDNDVKMTEAEVIGWFNCTCTDEPISLHEYVCYNLQVSLCTQGSASNGSGESSAATSQDGKSLYDSHDLSFIMSDLLNLLTCAIYLT